MAYRQKLLKDQTVIKVKDFGAGSKVFSSEERKVSKIAKNAGVSEKRALLLNKLVSYLKIKYALELGTSVGISSAAIAAGNQVELTTLEGCPETANIARKYFEEFGLSNITVKTGSFKESLPKVTMKQDFIYFDGNHTKKATLDYFYRLLPLSHNDSIFIFDDIHWSQEMEEAWEEIKDHPEVRVSIDTFYWGLIFFRKEQHKEHFVLRL